MRERGGAFCKIRQIDYTRIIDDTDENNNVRISYLPLKRFISHKVWRNTLVLHEYRVVRAKIS